jgi:hypothetical protein
LKADILNKSEETEVVNWVDFLESSFPYSCILFVYHFSVGIVGIIFNGLQCHSKAAWNDEIAIGKF